MRETIYVFKMLNILLSNLALFNCDGRICRPTVIKVSMRMKMSSFLYFHAVFSLLNISKGENMGVW